LMRLGEMKEEKKRLRPITRGDPLERGVECLFAAALHLSDRALTGCRRHTAVVQVESLIDSGRRAQHVCRNASAGRPSARLPRTLNEPLSVLYGEPDVVAHAVLEWQLPR